MVLYTPSRSASSEDSPFKMQLVYFSNELPYDDLQSLFRQILQHSKERDHPHLALFLQEATLALRDEVRQLSTELKSSIPPFESVLNFAEFTDLRQGPLGGSVDGILLCTVEIAALIGNYEKHPETFDHGGQETILAGLGLGLLASAALSLASTVADLPQTGAQVLRQAFRLGVLVDDVSQIIQPRNPGESPESWAYVLPDTTSEEAQDALDSIQQKESTPESSKIFLSAKSTTSVTVSGPPARLRNLFRSDEHFRDRKHIALPVFSGLCHASHIYTEDDVQSIVRTPSMQHLDSIFAPRCAVLSTSSGRPFEPQPSTARGLFEHIIREILTQKIEWDNVIHHVVERTQDMKIAQCQVLNFRVSIPINDLTGALMKQVPGIEILSSELIPWIHEKKVSDEPNCRGPMQSKIAIVGMACRLPGGATDTEKFWDILEKGLDVHRKIPADRFDVESHYDPNGKRMNASHTPYGCFIDEPGLFDAPFFNMSPREAQQTDPMQRLILVTAYEALERSGYGMHPPKVANRTAATDLHRIGTFYGQASDDYREVNTAQEISTYFIPGGCRAFGPGRINYFFKFSGPSYSIDTACSSSLATIQTACTSLWNGEIDMAVAGGTNVLTNSDAFAGLSHGHFLSKTPNACKTWDSEADGYCRADAVGSVVMKRLDDAIADNDRILGVISAAGTNHSAEAVSITHPHAGHQAYLNRLALGRAGINPLDVGFVELHGTGTQAGDAEEMQSVTETFAPLTKRRGASNPLYIGAVKSNIGHSEAGAGVSALLKVLLMMQKNAIPPHIGIKNSINPRFKDLDKRNVRIPYEKTPWPLSEGKKRVAVVNNFSAAGGNTTIVVEDGPAPKVVTEADPRSAHVVALSAKSKISLRSNLERMLAHIAASPDTKVPDLGYTTTARRYHHNHRVAFVASELEQVKKQLTSALAKVDTHKPIPSTGPVSIAFSFTGQGASFRSYSLELFHDVPYFRSQILHLDGIAQRQGFPSFVPVLNGSHEKDFQHSPVVTQLAQTCAQMALTKYLGTLGIKPNVVIGHSLGEYAALHSAGVLSASDTIFLVGKRAQMLQERCKSGSHKMVAVRASLKQIQESIGDGQEGDRNKTPYEIACMNGPNDTVLSGPAADMDAAIPALEQDGYKCFALDVSFAFHSAQTDPVLKDFETVAAGVIFQPLQVPVISPLLGKVVFDDKSLNANYLRRATRESVNFLGALEAAQKIGAVDEDTAWVEIGPHPVCTNFVKSSLQPSLSSSATAGGPAPIAVAVPTLRRGENNWQTLGQALAGLHCAGAKVHWQELHAPFEKNLNLLDLPTYGWNEKTYWLQYNGDWALTKGNTFYDEEKKQKAALEGSGSSPLAASVSNLSTSTVQRIVEERFDGVSGSVVMQSDLRQADFRAASWGHKMNGCGVVTSSIHADIAYTLGEYLYKKLKPKSKQVNINVANLEVLKGLVSNNDTSKPQLIQVSLSTPHIDGNTAEMKWYNVDANGAVADDFFASATLYFTADAATWLESWRPLQHLVQGRVAELERLAAEGVANRLSHAMAYRMFATNLVDYADKYRGMQSVVMHELEAFADVELYTGSGSGSWTVPPHFIDSVAHLAGFVMNVSDAADTKNSFAVTPGWASMRFARPLVPGGRYRSYVRMIPTPEDASVFLGDVYIMDRDTSDIVGMVGAIQFRRYPRILLSRFFSAPDDSKAPPVAQHGAKSAGTAVAKPAVVATPTSSATTNIKETVVVAAVPEPKAAAPVPATTTTAPPVADDAVVADADTTTSKALRIIADESAIELSELTDDASFANLGIDSLMSLVIAEKFREQLGVIVSGSLFLEYPNIGDLRGWLEEYYN